VKWIMKRAKAIICFIWGHHTPLAILCHFEQKLMFQNLVETRFTTTFLIIKRLLKVKLALEQIIIDLEWSTFVNTLHRAHRHKSITKARFVQGNIRKDGFWDTCANFVHMVELVLVALKEFNGKQPCMGNAWLIMKTLERHVLSLWDESFKLD
jgi:hypothetical protein